MGRRAYFKSGKMHCYDAEVENDLLINDDIVFKGVTYGTVVPSGGIDLTLSSSSYGIDMNGGTISTADLRLCGGATIQNKNGTHLTITETNIALISSGAIVLNGGATIQNLGTTLTITEGTIVLSGAVTSSGTITLGGGATIDNSDASYLTLSETNVALVGIIALNGSTTISGATSQFTLPGGATIDNRHSSTLTITESNIILAGNVTITSGDLTLQAGASITNHASALTITETQIVLAGEMRLTSKAGPAFSSGDSTAFGTFVTASQPGDKFFHTGDKKWYFCMTAGTMMWELSSIWA